MMSSTYSQQFKWFTHLKLNKKHVIDPKTTSDVVHGVEVSRLDCVCPWWCPEPRRGTSAERSDRKPCTNRTALVVSVLFYSSMCICILNQQGLNNELQMGHNRTLGTLNKVPKSTRHQVLKTPILNLQERS